MPIPIAKHVGRVDPDEADQMAEFCSIAYRQVFGKENSMRMPYSKQDIPVVCVSHECDFWQLECNDPEIQRSHLDEIVHWIQYQREGGL